MYSSRHNHALRRSREGSGRFVGGPVDATTNEASSITPSSSLTSYQSEPNNTTVTTSTSTNNYLPFSQHIETPQEPHQTSCEGNTNNNNHQACSEEGNLVKSASEGEETSVPNKERGTVITSIAVS